MAAFVVLWDVIVGFGEQDNRTDMENMFYFSTTSVCEEKMRVNDYDTLLVLCFEFDLSCRVSCCETILWLEDGWEMKKMRGSG